MKIPEKIEIVNEVESHGLDLFIIEGVNWWPLIRIYLFQNHEIKKSSKPIICKDKLNYFKRVVWDYRVYKNSLKKRKQLKTSFPKKIMQADYLFLSDANNYKEGSDGKLINRYLDPAFIQMDESKTIFMRGPKEEKEYSVNDVASVQYIEYKLLCKEQLNALFRTTIFRNSKKKFANKNSKSIKEIIAHLQKYPLLREFNFANLDSWFDLVIFNAEVAKELFLLIEPKVFMQYCFYFPSQFGYTLAASRLGIVSVDYQHGSQNKWHYGYGSWKNVPAKGYWLLPSEFWVYGNKEKTSLNESFQNSRHSVKIVGNKWIVFWKKTIRNNFEESFNWVKKYKDNNYKIFLFTLSNKMIDENHFIWDYIKSVKNEKVYWLFRLHPGYKILNEALLMKLNQLDVVNFEIDKTTKSELYNLLNLTDLHFSEFSSVAEEALGFGIKTILLDEVGRLYYEQGVIARDMFYPRSKEELINTVLSNVTY